MADTIDTHSEMLADLVVQEQGKPRGVARAEAAGLAYWLRATADIALPDTVNQDDEERRSLTRHVPLGVVAAITPWNYPSGKPPSNSDRPCWPATPSSSSPRRSPPGQPQTR